MRYVGEVHQFPAGRALFVDPRGMGLRATWHLERGIVNLSIWRNDRCVETFWLAVDDAARMVRFLVDGMAAATQSLVEESGEAGSADQPV